VSKYFSPIRCSIFLKNKFSLLLLTPFFIAAQYYYLTHSVDTGNISFLVVTLTGCLTMFVLAFRMQAWGIAKFLRVLGYHSLYIYVMHVFVVAFFKNNTY